MKFSTIAPLAFIAILSTMVTISFAAPAVEATNNKSKPPNCKIACTKEYSPRCAKLSSGKYQTFGNQCTFEAFVCEHPKEKVNLISKTACPEDPPQICGIACMNIYDPICAKFQGGKTETFGNQCEMDRAMCRTPKEKVMVTKGECPK